MALVGSLVPGVEMATSRGQKDVAEGVLWGLEIGAKKSLRGSRGRTQTTMGAGPNMESAFGGCRQKSIRDATHGEVEGVGSKKTR